MDPYQDNKGELIMKTTIPKLRNMIRKALKESNYGYGGHEGGSMAGHSGRGADMPLPRPRAPKQNWMGFKEMVEQGDIEGATDFLDAIGATDPMEQEAFLADAMELTAGQLAKEWSYRSEQMMESRRFDPFGGSANRYNSRGKLIPRGGSEISMRALDAWNFITDMGAPAVSPSFF